jgi:hypothetical protein
VRTRLAQGQGYGVRLHGQGFQRAALAASGCRDWYTRKLPRLLRPRRGEFRTRDTPASAQLADRLDKRARRILYLIEKCDVAVERIVAGGVRFVVADIAVEYRRRAHRDEAHPRQPVLQGAAHAIHALNIALHDHRKAAPREMLRIRPTDQFKRLGLRCILAIGRRRIRIAAIG